MGKHARSVDTRVAQRLRERGTGWVFTPADLADLGSRTAVATALMRQKAAGTVRQLARGLYDAPGEGPGSKRSWPSAEDVVAAVQRRLAIRVQPTGAYAANALGLSEQVPMRVVFLTDGLAREIKLGRLSITFRRATPRNMATAGRASGLVIQALRWLGRAHVHAAEVSILRRVLRAEDKRRLLEDLRYAPVWIAEVMRKVAAEKEE